MKAKNSTSSSHGDRPRRSAWKPTPVLARVIWLLTALVALPTQLTAQDPPSNPRVTPTNLCVSLGATATFRVSVGGTMPYWFQWHCTNSGNSFPLDGVANPSALRNVLNLTNVQSSDAGGYFVVVTNDWGSATSQVATLSVDPTFVKRDLGPGSTDMYVPYWVDLDGDGWLELVVSGGYGTSGGKPLMVWENNRDGTLSRIQTNDLSKVSGRFAYLAWADLDNDGDLDAFVGAWEGETPLYLRNEGGGHYTKVLANRYWSANGIAVLGSGPACADYDNDGILDLVVAYWGNSATGVWALMPSCTDSATGDLRSIARVPWLSPAPGWSTGAGRTGTGMGTWICSERPAGTRARKISCSRTSAVASSCESPIVPRWSSAPCPSPPRGATTTMTATWISA